MRTTGSVADINEYIVVDDLAVNISNLYVKWQSLRQPKMADWDEVRRYLYATDTKTTTNSKLPWKNSTTYPKLCQISDNLYANYIKALFPKRKWMSWIAFDEESDNPQLRKLIENFMYYVVDRSGFRDTASHLIQDFIIYGNAFAIPEWIDNSKQNGENNKAGYVGPGLKRISPLDIVFNPIASTFERAPKIERTLISFGDVKDLLESESTEENRKDLQALFDYLKNLRNHAGASYDAAATYKDSQLMVDGFGSFRQYLQSSYAEVLTFYGDIYDVSKDIYYKNHIIRIIDRHKVMSITPNPSYFGEPPVYKVGWRDRQDNLWSMGPLENLVGMQYRIDHLENLKADVFDLTAFPVLKIKGYVDDFEWGPMEKIFLGDEGDVEMVAPTPSVLNVDMQIEQYANKMEEMAGAPKEALGFRTPGEKTAYEVSRLENAASRVFQTKIELFEIFIEKLLNAMLELARRQLTTPVLLRIFDDELKIATFESIQAQDLTGVGKIVPMAARHFAEQAEKVQNASQFFAPGGVGSDAKVRVHFSGLKLAEMFNDLLDLHGYEIFSPFVQVSEDADAQREMNAHSEQVQTEAMTPSGLTPGDTSNPVGMPTGGAPNPTGRPLQGALPPQVPKR